MYFRENTTILSKDATEFHSVDDYLGLTAPLTEDNDLMLGGASKTVYFKAEPQNKLFAQWRFSEKCRVLKPGMSNSEVGEEEFWRIQLR